MIKINNIIQLAEREKKGTILEIDHVEGNKIGSFIGYTQTIGGDDKKTGYFKTISTSLNGDKIISSGYYNKLDERYSIEDINKILEESSMYLVSNEEEIKKVSKQCCYC